MKYTILINQKRAWELFGEKVDLYDLVILDYLRDICSVKSDKIKRIIKDGKEYTWINYSHIVEEIPYLPFKDRRGIYNRMVKLESLGIIEKVTQKKRTYVTLTDLAYKLFFSDNVVHTDGHVVQADGQRCPPRWTNHSTNDHSTKSNTLSLSLITSNTKSINAPVDNSQPGVRDGNEGEGEDQDELTQFAKDPIASHDQPVNDPQLSLPSSPNPNDNRETTQISTSSLNTQPASPVMDEQEDASWRATILKNMLLSGDREHTLPGEPIDSWDAVWSVASTILGRISPTYDDNQHLLKYRKMGIPPFVVIKAIERAGREFKPRPGSERIKYMGFFDRYINEEFNLFKKEQARIMRENAPKCTWCGSYKRKLTQTKEGLLCELCLEEAKQLGLVQEEEVQHAS